MSSHRELAAPPRSIPEKVSSARGSSDPAEQPRRMSWRRRAALRVTHGRDEHLTCRTWRSHRRSGAGPTRLAWVERFALRPAPLHTRAGIRDRWPTEPQRYPGQSIAFGKIPGRSKEPETGASVTERMDANSTDLAGFGFGRGGLASPQGAHCRRHRTARLSSATLR